MKIFHIADLHIGKIVNGFSMIDDQQYILNNIVELIKSEKPGAVLISGDVYDKYVPSVAAISLFDDFLTRLSKLKVYVFIISGNHDSTERLSFAGRIMEKSKIYFSGSFSGKIKKVKLQDEEGDICFHLLPFIRPAVVKEVYKDQEIDSYSDAIGAVLKANLPEQSIRNVLLAHQFVVADGISPKRCDSETEPVGGLNQIEASLFRHYDYVALGHLHGAQNVGSDYIRYAGSPLKYSFSECCQNKSISVIHMNKKNNLQIEEIPLIPLRDMRKIRGPMEELLKDDIINSQNPEDYLQITLTNEEEIIDAIGKLRCVYPNVMELKFENMRTKNADINLNDVVLKQKSSLQLFEEFFKEQNVIEMSPSQLDIIKENLQVGEE